MKRQIALLTLCAFVLGTSACSIRQNYLYRPSPFEKAVERATNVSPDGKKTITTVSIADIDVREWAEDVTNAWRKRDQIAKGLEITGASAESGLGVLGAVMSFFEAAPYVGPIISSIGSYITKLTNAINPGGRTEAYADGIEMLSSAISEYHTSIGGTVPSDQLTGAGKNLLRRTNCSIGVVEGAISGKATDKSKCN